MTPNETWHLETRHLGRQVLVFDQLESTNTLAMTLAREPDSDGIVVLAREQSAGRGQYGRSWQCSRGSGVLLSAVLFPSAELRRPALLTAWVAVSVCETIHRVAGLETSIKWPNDVLVRGRKVCGILIEQARGTVVGIGLNVNQTEAEFAAAGLPLAASLRAFSGRQFETEEVACQLIRQLDAEYGRLIDGDVPLLETRWRQGFGLLGSSVRVESTMGWHRGRLTVQTFAGLELEDADGQRRWLVPETVQHLEAEE